MGLQLLDKVKVNKILKHIEYNHRDMVFYNRSVFVSALKQVQKSIWTTEERFDIYYLLGSEYQTSKIEWTSISLYKITNVRNLGESHTEGVQLRSSRNLESSWQKDDTKQCILVFLLPDFMFYVDNIITYMHKPTN